MVPEGMLGCGAMVCIGCNAVDVMYATLPTITWYLPASSLPGSRVPRPRVAWPATGTASSCLPA